MDQTLLYFIMDNNMTYEKTSADEVWIASDQLDLEKCHCTVQLTTLQVKVHYHLF